MKDQEYISEQSESLTPEKTESTKDSLDTWHPKETGIKAMQGNPETQKENEWVEKGMQEVPTDQIRLDEMEHVNSKEDFKKVPYEDMVEGFNKLDTVVKPAVDNGADGDYFYNLDQQKNLDYPHGYQKIYESFYGGDAIKLDKDENGYHIINGAHRVYVANQEGINSVPARVTEKQEKIPPSMQSDSE